jgi:hypothetical protein
MMLSLTALPTEPNPALKMSLSNTDTRLSLAMLSSISYEKSFHCFQYALHMAQPTKLQPF